MYLKKVGCEDVKIQSKVSGSHGGDRSDDGGIKNF
jgi:hypothetical protein